MKKDNNFCLFLPQAFLELLCIKFIRYRQVNSKVMELTADKTRESLKNHITQDSDEISVGKVN